MGRTLTYKYAITLRYVELADPKRTVKHFVTGWLVKELGKPTYAAIRDYAKSFEDSTLPGGANAHLGVLLVTAAWVYDQHTDYVMGQYDCTDEPAFVAI